MDALQHQPLYVVGIISGVIWLGLFSFLFAIERRVRKLEQDRRG